MGELLKKYGKVYLKSSFWEIELNAPLKEKSGGTVHIQNKSTRMEMSQADFYKFVANLNLAKENLNHIKGMKDE